MALRNVTTFSAKNFPIGVWNNYGSKTKISHLTNDALGLVFRHLYFWEKVAVQRVSKRWNFVSSEAIQKEDRNLFFRMRTRKKDPDFLLQAKSILTAVLRLPNCHLEKEFMLDKILIEMSEPHFAKLVDIDFRFLKPYQIFSIKSVAIRGTQQDFMENLDLDTNPLVFKPSNFVKLFLAFPQLTEFDLFNIKIENDSLGFKLYWKTLVPD